MKKIAIFTAILMIFAVFGQVVPPVNAGGVTLFLDLSPDTNYNGGVDANGIVSTSTITTEPEIAVSTADDVYFAFLADGEFAIGETLTFTFPSGWSTAACGTATTDADADQTADGAFVHGGAVGTSTYTFTAGTTQASATGTEFCIAVTTDASPGNEVVTLSSSSTVPASSAAFIYNGDDNDVIVTANVQQNLYFAIRTTADDADTNACDLGTLDSGTVNTCDYRLAIETAANGGFTAYIDDTSGSPGLTSGANDIDAIVEDVGGTVTAGDEEYGVAFTGASSATSTVSEEGIFTDDDTPIPTSKTSLVSADGPYAHTAGVPHTDTSLVTHRASIDATTAAGSYNQTVSYYVTANF